MAPSLPHRVEPAGELQAVFGGAPPGTPIRLTGAGLFVPTPVPVLAAVFEALLEAPALATPEPLTVLDAGAGDGRMLAALGLIAPAPRTLRLVGIECDETLHQESCERLAALARRPAWPSGRGAALLHGDWSSPEAFDTLGLELADFDLVLNYPDGNETRLAELLVRRGRPSGRLALIQPDAPRQPPGCHVEWSARVAPGAEGPGWHVSLLGWRS